MRAKDALGRPRLSPEKWIDQSGQEPFRKLFHFLKSKLGGLLFRRKISRPKDKVPQAKDNSKILS
jgi:hypothetical protein